MRKISAVLALILCCVSCSKTASEPPKEFLDAKLQDYMEKVGYKDLRMTVRELVEMSSDKDARHWTQVTKTDWTLTLDLPPGREIVMYFSAVPELKGDVLFKSLKQDGKLLEGFGISVFVGMLQAEKNRKH